MQKKLYKVGTRNSKLALAQSEIVLNELRKIHRDFNFELVPIITTGDFRRDNLSLLVQDKKQWVIEIEKMLIKSEIDFAIHSAKDVPLNIEPETTVLPILPREDSRDVLLLKNSINSILDLRQGAVIGTSSKRRKAQLLNIRPDLEIVQFRGNIDSRIEKFLSNAEFDGIILASSGMLRIKKEFLNKYYFESDEMLPAIGQGQLLAQFLVDREEINDLLNQIVNKDSHLSYQSEQALVKVIGADCHSSLGVHAFVEGDYLEIRAIVLSSDGSQVLKDHRKGLKLEAIKLGEELAKVLLANGADSLLKI